MPDTLSSVERSASELVGTADPEAMGAEEIIELMIGQLHPKVALACSFQKEESVLLDMLLQREPRARVFALDTHVLFPETYETWRAVEQRYGIAIETFEGPTLAQQAETHGDALWERKPDLCCAIRKVAPLARALAGLDGWIVGVRRDQSAARAATAKLTWDDGHELWKAAPLADWSDTDVWAYVRDHDLPVNPLHERGYASIGCTHCTRPGEGRAGRWTGHAKDECGLHR